MKVFIYTDYLTKGLDGTERLIEQKNWISEHGGEPCLSDNPENIFTNIDTLKSCHALLLGPNWESSPRAHIIMQIAKQTHRIIIKYYE